MKVAYMLLTEESASRWIHGCARASCTSRRSDAFVCRHLWTNCSASFEMLDQNGGSNEYSVRCRPAEDRAPRWREERRVPAEQQEGDRSDAPHVGGRGLPVDLLAGELLLLLCEPLLVVSEDAAQKIVVEAIQPPLRSCACLFRHYRWVSGCPLRGWWPR